MKQIDKCKWLFVIDGHGDLIQRVTAAIRSQAEPQKFIVISEVDQTAAKRTFAMHTWDLVVVDETLSSSDEFPSFHGATGEMATRLWSVNTAESAQALSKRLADVTKRRDLPVVVVIEDDPFLLLAWSEILEDCAEMHVFRDPGAFETVAKKHPQWLLEIAWCITDYLFPEYQGQASAESVAALCSQVGTPTFLCSNGDFSDEILQRFTGLIDKVPHTVGELQALYAR